MKEEWTCSQDPVSERLHPVPTTLDSVGLEVLTLEAGGGGNDSIKGDNMSSTKFQIMATASSLWALCSDRDKKGVTILAVVTDSSAGENRAPVMQRGQRRIHLAPK